MRRFLIAPFLWCNETYAYDMHVLVLMSMTRMMLFMVLYLIQNC